MHNFVAFQNGIWCLVEAPTTAAASMLAKTQLNTSGHSIYPLDSFQAGEFLNGLTSKHIFRGKATYVIPAYHIQENDGRNVCDRDGLVKVQTDSKATAQLVLAALLAYKP